MLFVMTTVFLQSEQQTANNLTLQASFFVSVKKFPLAIDKNTRHLKARSR